VPLRGIGGDWPLIRTSPAIERLHCHGSWPWPAATVGHLGHTLSAAVRAASPPTASSPGRAWTVMMLSMFLVHPDRRESGHRQPARKVVEQAVVDDHIAGHPLDAGGRRTLGPPAGSGPVSGSLSVQQATPGNPVLASL